MKLIAGVDEVGRGPLAGPVYSAAVILPDNHPIIGLEDSKKISHKKREYLFIEIQKHALSIGIGFSDIKTIDKINIREASFLAMENALKNLTLKPDRALIDGVALKNQDIPNKGVIRGDTIYDNIKAASIIAKVIRDKLMTKYNLIFPEYNFNKNSGYGTKEHIKALIQHKASPIHRKTFNRVRQNLPTLKWLEENNRLSWMGNKFAGLFLLKNKFDTKKKIIKADMNKGVFLIKENQQKVIVTVFTAFRDKYTLFNSNKLLNIDKFKNSTLNYFDEPIKLENDFRFDIINVTLMKAGPLIQYIPAVNLNHKKY